MMPRNCRYTPYAMQLSSVLKLKSTRVVVIYLLLHLNMLRAQDPDALSGKFQHYSEDAGRIQVWTEVIQLEKNLFKDTKLTASYLLDTLSGASPTGAPSNDGGLTVPLSGSIDEERTAVSVALAQKIDIIHSITVGYNHSVESDYISHAFSLNNYHELNKRNTIVRYGVAYADDTIDPGFWQDFNGNYIEREKTVWDLFTGITQIVDPNTMVSFNVTYHKADGYLSDPYKISQLVENLVIPGFDPIPILYTFSDNRPEEAEALIFYAEILRHIPQTNGTIEGSYRFYTDDWGLDAHTIDLKYLQRLWGEKMVLIPSIRYYQQSAVDFYYYDLTTSGIVLPRDEFGNYLTSNAWDENRPEPHYTSDYRLSKMRTWNLGLKLAFFPKENVTLDAAVERYTMHGRDGVTPKAAYANAWIYTLGMKVEF